MRKAGIALVLATAALAQEQVVQRAGIWTDTVKHGDIPLMVRGLGVLGAGNTAELKMPGDIMKQVEGGQKASVITTEQAVIEGKVARVGSGVVILELDGPLPATAHPGTPVDGTIQTGNLSGVEYVGRPVHCQLDGEDTIFRLDPDGQHATRVKVLYGNGSVNLVEVRRGLRAGEQVILTDMSGYKGQDRVRIE